jgi:hypothetical protein
MEPTLKGYIIQFTGRFMLQDPVISARLPARMVESIEANAEAMAPASFYPRAQVMDLWTAIAEAYDDEAEAYRAIVRCGEAVGAFASGTFLKLVLKMLTPRMFANKFPDMYARDHHGPGHAEVVSIADKSLSVVLKDVGGFAHIGPIAAGWGAFTLKAIGLKGLEMSASPWSRREPGPAEVHIKASWK